MKHGIQGIGLGLRRNFMQQLQKKPANHINFFEIAPENWLKVGGSRGKNLAYFLEHYPVILHGLSLSLGSQDPLNVDFIRQVKQFIKQHNIPIYSEHLSYCSDHGQLYDLMPIPFTEEAVLHVSNRIRQVQDILEQRIGVENISYYAAPGQEMSEVDFINAVLSEADCDLLLDVNNIFVNSYNHGYDANEFLKKLTPKHICYIHIAGHDDSNQKTYIDTHGESIKTDVWQLLKQAYQQFGIIPTLLERDSNFPEFCELQQEINTIYNLQQEVKHASQIEA